MSDANRRSTLRAVALLLGLGLVPAVGAQGWPDKPVRIVVPYGPGGLGDVLARGIGKKLGDTFGHPVVIENKPGAAGMLGATAVAKSPADGYTVLLGYTSEMTVAPQMVKEPAYDTTRDFEPVALAGVSPLLLVAHPSTPGDTLPEFIRAAKSAPDKYSYASAGPGSPAHFAGEQLRKSAGISLLHVPYKGGAQAVTDTLAGVVSIYFSGFPPAVPHVRAGKLKALAVTGKARSPALPNVPTMDESGLKDFDLSGWFGFFVPRGTPAPVIKRLNEAIAAAVAQPDLKESLANQGVETIPGTAAEFGAFVAAEQKKYGAMIGALNLRDR
jgi:tripartite-type tricarboxylate transporter receptor subunit TctC